MSEMRTEEEKEAEQNGWRAAAAACDLSLEGIDLNDKDQMKEVYAALNVGDFPAKSRLQGYIRRLREQRRQERIDRVVDYVLRQEADAATLVISEPQAEQYRRALKKLNFRLDAAMWESKPSADELPTPPHPHVWLASEEDSEENRARYMEYLRNPNNIILPYDIQLFEGNSRKDLLL